MVPNKWSHFLSSKNYKEHIIRRQKMSITTLSWKFYNPKVLFCFKQCLLCKNTCWVYWAAGSWSLCRLTYWRETSREDIGPCNSRAKCTLQLTSLRNALYIFHHSAVYRCSTEVFSSHFYKIEIFISVHNNSRNFNFTSESSALCFPPYKYTKY